MRSFLILHGLGGSADGHWQEWLAAELEKSGEKVWFPQLPEADAPRKDSWLHALRQTLDAIPADDCLTVITHSLGCILWLHYAAQQAARHAERLIMVCPPAAQLQKREIEDFFPLPEDRTVLLRTAERAMLILSSDDPFLPEGEMNQYFDYHVPCLIFPERGHINKKAGYGPWPWMFRLCTQDVIDWPVDGDQS